MSAVIAAATIWSGEKEVALPKPKRHLHKPSPVSPGFVAPTVASNLVFGPLALAAAISRTATTREEAPIEVVERAERRALLNVEYYIRDGRVFDLSPSFEYMVDIERSHFAGEVGAGIAHLYMESLGYKWRANACCLTSKREAHGDFLYHSGSVAGHGVVLAEAHGSFSSQVTASSIKKECEEKYLRQVRPWVGTDSIHGKVVHGYSVAFGCRPGNPGALIALSETRIRKERKKAGPPAAMIALPSAAGAEPPGGAAPTSMALTTHRSNFVLIGARPVAKWIDWLRGIGDIPTDRDPIEFLRLEYAGRRFLASIWPSWSPEAQMWLEIFYDHPMIWRHGWRRGPLGPNGTRSPFGWFVIEESAGDRFLNELSAMIRQGPGGQPERLELPVLPSEGFGFGAMERRAGASPEYDYALFSDGLALLGRPDPRSIIGGRVWSPKEGLQ
jgi:hypothetical protein